MASGSATLGLPYWEAAVYVTVVGAAFQHVLLSGVSLSREFEQGGARHGALPGLVPGWILGHRMDLSDIQWRVFRESLPLVTLAMGAFTLGGNAVRKLRPTALVPYYLIASVLYIGYLHGLAALFPLSIALLNFWLSSASAGKRYSPAAIWAWNCGILLLARSLSGFSFQAMSAGLAPLDAYTGVQRWHVCFNLVALRCISFSMDRHWAAAPPAPSASSAKAPAIYQSLPLPEYTLGLYLAYVFYPPLYIAGPVMTFNAFAANVASRARPPWKTTLLYVLRLGASLLVLELMTHFLYFNAIAKHRVWAKRHRGGGGPAFRVTDVGITAFWVLNFMWLKFLVIWRFFRAAALLDGIEPPENMLRCVNNNYDIEGFWRGWHASFNRWLVRYLYVPLGGASRKLFTVWAVFTFVAAWHDVDWRMISWAWLMCIFFAPELLAKWAAKQPWRRYEWVKSSSLFRHVAALGATCNITMLMTVNMLGFVIGVDGAAEFLSLLWRSGPVFLASVFATFYSAAQIMFAIRFYKSRRSVAASRVE